YLPEGGTTTLNLGKTAGNYLVQWYNPRTGGALQSGTVVQLTGSGIKSLGLPPQNDFQDWVCLVRETTVLASNEVATNLTKVQPNVTFSVFPNPVQNQLIIHANQPLHSPINIVVRDVNGKPVLQYSVADRGTSNVQLNTQQLPSGIYLVQIHYGTQFFTRKLVK
ncbi:MAG: T9SS type A sorting domain-containing protein, partial [Bacteroidota bacterium]|nr:T9SS type A sorting domain-containing protein [Bacteroidota bacterium]